MPEHFHLLISEPEKANPYVVIQAVKLAVVRGLFPTSPKTREKWGTLGVFLDERWATRPIALPGSLARTAAQ